MKFFIVICACIAVAAARAPASPLSYEGGIFSKSFDLNDDGSYGWEFDTVNGISASENGVGGQFANGAAEWTSPEGEHIFFHYTADENGYHPRGSHVPKIPEYITRALEWIRTHPSAKQ